jgi:hypothetical protein
MHNAVNVAISNEIPVLIIGHATQNKWNTVASTQHDLVSPLRYFGREANVALGGAKHTSMIWHTRQSL